MDVRIRILLKIIEERAGVLEMSPEQVGSLLGIGEARLLRLFNSEVGKTLRSHLRDVRMAQAAAMLTDCVLPIKTIAHRCGYSAVTNFYRDFKLVHGTSPVQLRKSQLRNKYLVSIGDYPRNAATRVSASPVFPQDVLAR